MRTFEITVQRKLGESWPVVVEQEESGGFLPVRTEGRLDLDLAELLASPSPRAYGERLGRALFRDDVRDALANALARSADPLHVLLSVEAEELRTLHWGRLCGPAGGGRWDFLRLQQRTPFAQFVPAALDRRFPAIGRLDLRALVLAGSPPPGNRFGLEPFDAAATADSVRRALGPVPCDVLAFAEGAAGPPTLDALCERLTAGRYTLLHVVCHGGADKAESWLYLADAAGGVDPVPGSRLVERLARLNPARGLPHLAYLCACETALPEAEGALGGIAQRLVRELGTPAAVAMTDKVTVATAEALSARFYERLRDHGAVDLALDEACAGLAERGDVTVPALFGRLGGRKLFDDAGTGPLTNSELVHGLDRLGGLLPERAPVLEAEFARQAEALRRTLGAEYEALAPEARKERDEALSRVEALCLEAADLSFRALGRGQQPPGYDGRCPFPGLLPFTEQGGDGKREFFFGREKLVADLKTRLAEERFLAVAGGSGSGKSSLVRAGLLAELERAEPGRTPAVFKPGADPSPALRAALAAAGDGPKVLVADQFEELFTLCSEPARRAAFLAELLPLRGEMPVVLTVRVDFLGECAEHPELRTLVQRHQALVAPMDAAELREAIERQRATVGLRFEAGLANRILDDVQGEPGAMPLLQHALLQLWKRRHGRWLKADEYADPDKVGGVKGAISRTADELYERSPEDRELIRYVFERLTRIDADAAGPEHRRDTRRRAPLPDLTPAGGDPERTRRLVARLADAKLVVTTADLATGGPQAEVAHEALIRHWGRLQKWLDEARVTERLVDRVRDDAREWQRAAAAADRDSYLTLRGSLLAEAERLLAAERRRLTAAEADFVLACRSDADAQAAARDRLRRQILAGLSAGFVVALGLLAFAGLQWREASLANMGLADVNRKLEDETSNAKSAAREAELQLGLARVSQADSLTSAGRWLEAKESYKQSDLLFRKHAVSPLPADLAFWDLHQRAPTPLYILRESAWYEPWFLAASRDGRRILRDNSLWDVATGQELALAGVDSSTLRCAAFSPDGGIVLAGSSNGALGIWDARTGAGRPLEGHQDGVRGVVFSADGRVAASGSEDGVVKIWDVATWRGRTIDEPLVPPLAISADGSQLLLDGPALWRVGEGKRHDLPWENRDNILLKGAFSPDGSRAYARDGSGTVRAWKTETLEALSLDAAFPLPSGLSANGRELLIPKDEISGTLTLVDAKSGRESRILQDIRTLTQLRFNPSGGSPELVQNTAISHDGRFAFSVHGAGRMRVWDLLNGRQVLQRPGGSLAEFSPDGLLVLQAEQGSWTVLDAETGQELTKTPTHGFEPVLSGDRRLAVVHTGASDDGSLTVTEPYTGRQVDRWRAHEHGIRALAFSADGSSILSSSFGGETRLWSLTKDGRLATKEFQPLRSDLESSVTAAAFSPDGRLVLVGDKSGRLRLWDRDRRTELPLAGERHEMPQNGYAGVNDIAFSSDGKWVLSGGADGRLALWDIAERKEVRTFTGHSGPIAAVALSREGRWALSAGDASVRLWDVSTGREVRTVAGGSDAASAIYGQFETVAFPPSEGDRRALCASADVLQIWNPTPPEEYARFADVMQRSRAALKKSPNDARALRELGEAWASVGHWDWAIELIERARTGDPTNLSSLTLARCYWRRGDPDPVRVKGQTYYTWESGGPKIKADLEAARREFLLALDRKEAPEEYLKLCVKGVESDLSDRADESTSSTGEE